MGKNIVKYHVKGKKISTKMSRENMNNVCQGFNLMTETRSCIER